MQPNQFQIVSLSVAPVLTYPAQQRRPMQLFDNPDAVTSLEALTALTEFIDNKVAQSDGYGAIDFDSDDLAPFIAKLLSPAAVGGETAEPPPVVNITSLSATTDRPQSGDLCRFKLVVKHITSIGLSVYYVLYGYTDRPLNANSTVERNTLFTINSLHTVRAIIEQSVELHEVVDSMHLLRDPYFTGIFVPMPKQTQRPADVFKTAANLYEKISHPSSEIQVYDTRTAYSYVPINSKMANENSLSYLGMMLNGIFETHLRFREEKLRGMGDVDDLIAKVRYTANRLDSARPAGHPLLRALSDTPAAPTVTFMLSALDKIDPEYIEKLTIDTAAPACPTLVNPLENNIESSMAFNLSYGVLGVMGRFGIEQLNYTCAGSVQSLANGATDVMGYLLDCNVRETAEAELRALVTANTHNGTIPLEFNIAIDIGNEAAITLNVNNYGERRFTFPMYASALNSTMITTRAGLENAAQFMNVINEHVGEAFAKKWP